MAWITYNNEYVNLDNVIAAEEINNKCIKLRVIGSAGSPRRGGDGYIIQHRELTLHWPAKVFKDLMLKAGCLTLNSN